MTIRYSTNWMGPVSIQWYKDRGLTETVTKRLDRDSTISDKKRGDIITYERVTEEYSAGRIDCRGTDLGRYGDEIYLPPMKVDDWCRFSKWLDTLVTPSMWSLEKLMEQYEAEGNPKIEWWKDER